MWQEILILVVIFTADSSGSRVKRHLVFNEGSRLFFSVDIRDNLFDVSDLFANVLGFKIDWDLPSRITHERKKGRIQRRDLFQGIERFLYHSNFNGNSCIRKFICEAYNVLPNSEFLLAQLYEVVFATNEAEILNTYNISDVKNDCRDILKMKSKTVCPFSLLSLLHKSVMKSKLS